MMAQSRRENSANGSGTSQGMCCLSDAGSPSLSGGTRMSDVGLIAIVLLACAVAILVGAEWPRLSERLGGQAWAARSRRKRKQRLTLVQGEEGSDDFQRSVERDLDNLPVIEERDDRSRR